MMWNFLKPSRASAAALALAAVVPMALSAQPGTSMARPIPASKPSASVVEVYLACSSKRAQVDTDLKRFCHQLRLPRRGALHQETLALWIDTSTLPSVDDVKTAARDALREREDARDAFLRTGLSAADEVRAFVTDTLLKGRIAFDLYSAALTKAQLAHLDSVAPQIRARIEANPNEVLQVNGYADAATRNSHLDLQLAYRRGIALANALADRGIPRRNLTVEAIVLDPQGRAGRLAGGASAAVNAAAARNEWGKATARGAEIVAAPGLFAPLNTRPLIGAEGARASTGERAGGSLAMAATDALLDRASREMQQFVMAAAATRLCDQAAAYLEQTCRFFRTRSGTEYLPTFASLQSAIREDVEVVPERLALQAWALRLSGQGPPDATLGRTRQKALVAWYVLRYLGSVRDGEDPLRVISELHQWQLPSELGAAAAEAQQAWPAALVAFSRFTALADTAALDLEEYWPGVASARDSVTLYSLRTLLLNHPEVGAQAERLVQAKSATEEYASQLRELRTNLLAMKDSAGSAARQAQYAQFLSTSAAAMLAPLEFGINSEQRLEMQRFLNPVRDVSIAIGTRDYRGALHQLANLLQAFDSDNTAELGNVYCSAADRTKKACPRLAGLRVFSMVVDVAEARDQSELNGAFRNFVGQGSSFRRKRQGTGWYTFVNAYVGVAAGSETVQLPPETGEEGDRAEGSGYIGAHLPIGLEIGRPTAYGTSLSLFVPVLDLGGIAAQRLDEHEEEEIEDASDDRLSQLIAPGAYLVLGLPKVPVSVGAGWSWAPNAREREGTGQSLDARRFGFFLAVDLPVFP